MPRRRRLSTAGLIFHVVNRSAKRSRLFDTRDDYAAFVSVLAEGVSRCDVSLFAYCVMPNHWHLIVSADRDGELSRFMHWVTTTHARRWQLARRTEGLGAVYQGRFRAIPIAEDRHFLWVCRYVERNALRAALVNRAEDWPWSSLAEEANAHRIELTPWPVQRPSTWLEHVNAPQTEAELLAVRKAIAKNEALGEAEWQRTVRSRLGMGPRKSRGRPRRQCVLDKWLPTPFLSVHAHPVRLRLASFQAWRAAYGPQLAPETDDPIKWMLERPPPYVRNRSGKQPQNCARFSCSLQARGFFRAVRS